MKRNIKLGNGLPWFPLWTGIFRSKTDHLSNTEVGAYIRLLTSYWENNGLPFNQRALSRIAKIEPEDDVDLGTLVGEFFLVKDGILRNEELDLLCINAIGEEDANKRRTQAARDALAKKRGSVTIPVTDTDVEVDVDEEENPEGDPEREEDQESDSRPRNQTQNQTEHTDLQPEAETEMTQPSRQETAGSSVSQATAQNCPASVHQSASLKPDSRAQGSIAPAPCRDVSPLTMAQYTGLSRGFSAEQAERALETVRRRYNRNDKEYSPSQIGGAFYDALKEGAAA